MGSVFRRGYKDKKTGRVEEESVVIRSGIEMRRDAGGLSPPIPASKTLALRILAEKELALANPPASRRTQSSAGLDSPRIAELRDRYLASMRLRLRDSTYRMYVERLDYTIRDLGVEFAEEIDPIRIDALCSGAVGRGLVSQDGEHSGCSGSANAALGRQGGFDHSERLGALEARA